MATKQQKRGIDLKPLTFTGEAQPLGADWQNTSFVEPAAQAEEPAEEKKSGVLRRIADHGISLARGAIAVPEAAVGLADMVSGGAAGKFLENEDGLIGFRPKQAKEFLGEYLSPEQQAANEAFQRADGVVDKTVTALKNPSLISNAVAESLPMMGGGAVVGRGALALAPRMGTLGAAAAGEGVMGAGSAAETIRQETPGGTLTGQQVGLAAASGTLTAALGVLGGKVANKLGIGDVDQMLVKGSTATAADTGKGVLRRTLEGAVSEGFLEELPQSVQEQVMQNLALGKPIEEGLDGAAVMGVLSGMAMGGGANALSRPPTPGERAAEQVRAADKVPDAGPLSRAANEATEQKAQALEQTPPEVAPAPVAPEAEAALLKHANARAREIEEKAKGTKDSTTTDAEGNKVPVKGKQAEFLTPTEKDERDFLKEHGGDATQLARAYPELTQARHLHRRPQLRRPRPRSTAPSACSTACTATPSARRKACVSSTQPPRPARPKPAT